MTTTRRNGFRNIPKGGDLDVEKGVEVFMVYFLSIFGIGTDF
jgi:hypothetical protein